MFLLPQKLAIGARDRRVAARLAELGGGRVGKPNRVASNVRSVYFPAQFITTVIAGGPSASSAVLIRKRWPSAVTPGVAGEGLGEDLDGDVAAELGVGRAIHLAPAARAELFQHLVVGKGFAGHGRVAFPPRTCWWSVKEQPQVVLLARRSLAFRIVTPTTSPS